MARIISIDYGIKRCGVASTDPLQIIVNAVDTICTDDIRLFIKNYIDDHEVEKVVIGLPVHKDGNYTYLKEDIDKFSTYIHQQFPDMVVDFQDERLTSVFAKEILLKSGIKKMKRRDKSLIDKISAVIILQRYLGHI